MRKKNVVGAVEYLGRGPFEKVLKAIRIRYESIGETAGTIYTTPLSYEELAALADFMDVSVYTLDLQRKLSLKNFEEKLKAKYPGVKLQQLLSMYFGKETVPLSDRK
ncbi:hypothetical protein LC065_01400 [Halobacillus litoralis]|uniref:hypothetical protein n=1 Tax=Halobacillus litoralis TaxID=45668 RepID=UPI001CFEB12E|nr:hypothetical protein [Halobacillus litoralis]WLR47978.1 hypothetical protein LC065_01400 [Halobacillus litoralis]